MKKNTIKYVIAIATAVFIIGVATIAPADDTQKFVLDEIRTESFNYDNDFSSLLKIHRGIYEKLPGLTSEQSKEIMAEHIAFLEENQNILEDLQSKWAALAKELAEHKYGSEKALQLQNEIVSIDSELVAKRIDHLLTVEKMSSESGGQLF